MSVTATSRSNRRTNPRRAPRGNVQVHCVRGTLGLGPNLALRVLDTSETGVRLMVGTALDSGQEIEVQIVGPARGRASKLLADVVWCVPAADGTFCVGARFRKRLSYAELLDICR
jgi:hypothetical protein